MSNYFFIVLKNTGFEKANILISKIEDFFKKDIEDKIPENLKQHFRINPSQGKFGIYLEPFLGDKPLSFILKHKKYNVYGITTLNFLVDFISFFFEDLSILIYSSPLEILDSKDIEDVEFFFKNKFPKSNMLLQIKNKIHLYETEKIEFQLQKDFYLNEGKKISGYYQSFYIMSRAKKSVINIVKDYAEADKAIMVSSQINIKIVDPFNIPFPLRDLWDKRKNEIICFVSGKVYFS